MSLSNKGANVDPRLQSVTNALFLNSSDDVVMRSHVEGLTLQAGDILVDAVKLWDGSHYVQFELPNNDGETGGWAISTEDYNMVFNGSTWDRMRGNTSDGVFTKITNSVLPISKNTSANSNSNPIYVDITNGSISVSGTFWQETQPVSIASMPVTPISDNNGSITVDGTISLSQASLDALETITVNQGTAGASSWKVAVDQPVAVTDNDGSITIDDGDGSITVDGSVTVSYDPESGSVDYYGEPYSVTITPIVQINSYDGIYARDVQTYKGGGGDVTESDTAIAVSCSSTVGSYGVYRSRRFIPFRPGQSNVARILAKLDTPKLGTSQRIGLGNAESGFYIGYSGANDSAGTYDKLKLLHTFGGRCAVYELVIDNGATATTTQLLTITINGTVYTTTATSGDTVAIVAQKITAVINAISPGPWLASQVGSTIRLLQGTPGPTLGTFSVTSPGNLTGTFTQKVAGSAATNDWFSFGTLPSWLDLAIHNHWQFQYTWKGFLVFALHHELNQWKFLYRFIQPDLQKLSLPSRTPSFKASTVVYNVGGSNTSTLEVVSIMGAVEGIETITAYTYGGGTTQTSLAQNTAWHVMSIQNPYVNNNKINVRSIRFMDLTVAAQCNDPVEIYIYANQPLVSGTYNFQSFDNTPYQGDITKAEFDTSLDTPVAAMITGITGGGQQFNLAPYNLLLPPGEHMSLVVRSTAAIQKISIAGTWAIIG